MHSAACNSNSTCGITHASTPQYNMQGTVTVSEPIDEVELLFNSSALRHVYESDIIEHKVEFRGVAQSDHGTNVTVTFGQPLKVLVHVRALPSIQQSSLFLIDGSNTKYSSVDIPEGSLVAVRLDAKDEDGKSVSDKSKISPVVKWTHDGGPAKSVTLRYQEEEGSFYAQLLERSLPGLYTLWVSAVEAEGDMGTQQYILEGNVPGDTKCWLTQGLPTQTSGCLVY